MTHVERIKDADHDNARYGTDELLKILAIENAYTLAAIADALEKIAQIGRKERDNG